MMPIVQSQNTALTSTCFQNQGNLIERAGYASYKVISLSFMGDLGLFNPDTTVCVNVITLLLGLRPEGNGVCPESHGLKAVAVVLYRLENFRSPEEGQLLVIFCGRTDLVQNLLIGFGFILFIAFGIFQLVIGYQGIEYHLGAGWAIAALVCTFMFRFTLPITIGTYFGVVDVLEWHWILGLLVAAPGLLFIVPSIALDIFEPVTSKFSRKKTEFHGYNNDYGQIIDVEPVEENKSEHAVKSGKEVSVTIAALKKLRSEYDSEGIYHSSVVDDVFKQAEKIIRNDKKDVIEGIAIDKRDPAEIALTALWNVSNQSVSSGQYHVYRGILNNQGKGYLYAYNKTVDMLLGKGFIDEQEAGRNRKDIHANIKAVG